MVPASVDGRSRLQFRAEDLVDEDGDVGDPSAGVEIAWPAG